MSYESYLTSQSFDISRFQISRYHSGIITAMSTSSKASWIANSKRISLESDALEKKTNIGLKSDELKHEAIDLNKLRNESKVDTMKRVHGIRLVLSDIQNKIKNNSWQSSNALKNQLETFESKLTSFKLLMRSAYDSLDEQAISLENDLNQLGTDMESWDNNINDMDLSSLPDAETQKRIHERNKVDLERRAFIGGIDRKIAALGRDGGWDPRDQDTFLRVWLMVFDNTEAFEEQLAHMSLSNSQHNVEEGDDDSMLTPRHTELIVGPPPSRAEGTAAADQDELNIPQSKRTLIIKKLSTAIPWKSVEEFDQHIDWYLTYLRLTLIKKKVVAEWKQEQLSAKRQQQDAILAGDILQPGDATAGGGHFLNTSGSQDGSAAGDRSASGAGMVSAKERAAAKARIAKWKEAQAQQQRLEMERKAQEDAAETRRMEEERRRKQLQMREQLGRWKEAEQVNKELVGAASAKLQRPRSVDPAALRRRQARDLETAKARNERMEAAAQKKNQREKTIMEAAVPVTGLPAERDPQRLRSATKASEGNRLTYEALDQAQQRRGSVGAHGANIALSGRDLQYAGRATPQWMKTARGGY